MTTNRILPTVRMSVLSVFIALVAFSFLAFGSASAHTVSQASTGSPNAKTVVRIIPNRVFSPSAISVISGTSVKIVNKSTSSVLIFYNQGDFVLAPGAFKKLVVTQSQTLSICAGGSLTITVV